MPADEIVSGFPLSPRFVKSFNAPKTHRDGTLFPSGGRWPNTAVGFETSGGTLDHDETDLTDFLNDSVGKLPLLLIDRVIATGGACCYSLGIFTDGNFMCSFNEDFLSELAAHRIELRFDIYGGPENIKVE